MLCTLPVKSELVGVPRLSTVRSVYFMHTNSVSDARCVSLIHTVTEIYAAGALGALRSRMDCMCKIGALGSRIDYMCKIGATLKFSSQLSFLSQNLASE